MAILSDQDRFDAWAEWMRSNLASIPITKTDLRAMFNAADAWADANAASYNAALPLPGRTACSAPVKASILAAVILKRWLKGA